MLGKVYLLLYNCCLAFGWSLVLWWTIAELQLTQTTMTVYKKVEVALKLSQTLAVLEIVHAALGLVRSSPMTTFVQVLECSYLSKHTNIIIPYMLKVQSRLVVLWLVLDPVKEIQTEFNVPMMICAWCVAEIVRYFTSRRSRGLISNISHFSRYLYYALSLVDKVPYPLTWARYSFFTFLYPIGVSGELLTIYRYSLSFSY